MNHTLETTVLLSGELEQPVTVTYTYHKGYSGDHTDPPESASVEIQSVVPDVPQEHYDDLAVQCMEDYEAYQADAAEYRWQSRVDVERDW